MITISLCMIIRNEEKVLARCLDSVREAADEIILVDTGSTDRTREIAARYTDRVYDFKWKDDFSAARNFSFSKAGMDYILWLDADDVMDPDQLKALMELKDTLPEEVDVVMMRYQTAFDEDGNSVFSYYRERLIRRSSGPVWKGRVHEAIDYTGTVLYSEIAISHRSIKTSYSDRNLKIYERQLREENTLSPRDTFYYARELYYHRHYGAAVAELTRFLDAPEGWIENKIEACKILAFCYDALSLPVQSLSALTRSFLYAPPRAEICCEIGNRLIRMEAYPSAVFWFRLALSIPREDATGAFVSEDCYGYVPCIQLCVCYDRLGDPRQAEEYNRLAGTYRPHAPAYLQNLKYFEQLRRHP